MPNDERPTTVPHVLVVDDDPDVRHVVTRILEQRNFRVTAASDGADALSQLHASSDVAVVVLDLAMPGMSGEDVLRAIRVDRPTLRVIVSSGYGEAEGIAGDAEHVETVAKPYRPSELIAAIDRALD